MRDACWRNLCLTGGEPEGFAALADMGQPVGQQHDKGTDPGGVHQAEVLYHKTTNHGAERNADVEGGIFFDYSNQLVFSDHP